MAHKFTFLTYQQVFEMGKYSTKRRVFASSGLLPHKFSRLSSRFSPKLNFDHSKNIPDRLPDGSMYQFNIYPLALSHIVESLDVSKVNLIGHSLGGGVSGMYTALFPEKVERLILLDSAGMPLIRDDFKGHTKKAFLENVNYREKEEYQNTKVGHSGMRYVWNGIFSGGALSKARYWYGTTRIRSE